PPPDLPDPPKRVAPPEPPPGPPRFEDVTAAAGIDHTYRNGEEAGHFAILESLGGGVALLDYDRDGRLDIFLPGGGRYEGKAVLGQPCKLYRKTSGTGSSRTCRRRPGWPGRSSTATGPPPSTPTTTAGPTSC
ncbi:MAG: hypothetical protein K2X87_18355, partial [Gemmataceae bacterium]|nr:hypothetical protein [Gemmataceae bacterium]